MTDKEKLKGAFEDVIWMAIRYADGRHTYAPATVRLAIKEFQSVFPDWKPKRDITIKPPQNKEFNLMKLKEDYLYDLFEE